MKKTITTVVAAAIVGTGLSVFSAAGSASAAASSTANCAMAAGSGLATHAANGATNGTVDVLDSLAQVLPTKHFAGASAAILCSARDAYSSFQIEISANQGVPLTNIGLSASTLTRPGGATIPGTAAGASSDIQLDREDYVTLSSLSDSELDPANTTNDSVTPSASRVSRNETTGACTDIADSCRFPDELIPDRDSVYGQARNAFTNLTIPSGENRVAWVDVFVPTATPAGTYTGTVTITQGSGQPSTVPVQLQVVQAVLPATSTMDSAFFFEQPYSNGGTDYQAAAELALDDRISLVPDGDVGSSRAAIVSPLLNGTDAAVKLTDANGRHAALTDFPMQSAFQSFSLYKPLFTAASTTRAWAYCDESGASACAANYASNPAKEWPGIPLLAIDEPYAGAGDAWPDPETQVVPNQLSAITGGVVDLQQFLDPTYTNWLPATYKRDTADRSSYLKAWAAGAAGRQVWTYLSSESGSGPYSTSKVATGFASYGIDQIASEQQATGWTSFNDSLNGELYWEVNNSVSTALGTRQAGNAGLTGDGLLFYPYTAAVGGTHSVPLESIRLKRIRNGQQDNELLRLATTQNLSLADGRTARSISTALFPTLSSAAVPATALDTGEQDLFRLFPLPASVITPPSTKVVSRTDLNCDGTPDFIAVQADTGKLLFYPRTATDWTPNAPTTVGTGFGTTAGSLVYTGLLEPGDVNGDGSPDLIGRRSDGSMWLLAGNCTGSFNAAVKLAATTTDPIAPGDFNGDGHPDLLDKHADGTLWMLAGTGSGSFTAPTQVGAGWGSLQITAAGDFNHDGAIDLIARPSTGDLLLYEGNGTGGWKTVTGGIDTGLALTAANDPQLFGVGDLSGDGNADLVAIDSAGTMYRYNGNGASSLSNTATRIGGSWSPASLVVVAQ